MTSTDTAELLGPGWVEVELLCLDPEVDPLLIAEIDDLFVETLDPWRSPPQAPTVGTGTVGPDRCAAPRDQVRWPAERAAPRPVDATQRSPPARQ